MSHPNDKEQKRIERLINAIDYAYHHPGALFWRGFLGGLASGLGATVGVAIVLTVLAFLLREFGGLPVIGDWLNAVDKALPTR